jgi:hypothetical protein
MQAAYYAAPLRQFLAASPDTILGQLTHQAQDVTASQRYAWVQQIALLQQKLLIFDDGAIALEFSIPRMGKRVDAMPTSADCYGLLI